MTITAPQALGTPGVNRFTPAQLLRTARLFATDPQLDRLLDLSAPHRQWVELESTTHLQIWLLSWPAGASTGWHDHGSATGAFLTVRGRLREQVWSGHGSLDELVSAPHGRTFGAQHIHHVSNDGPETALSIHIYTPRLSSMNRYAVTPDGLRATTTTLEGTDW